MLDLNHPDWKYLKTAYGPATNVPALLTSLEREWESCWSFDDWESEPFKSLWSALCHQGDVYTASFAAVPHLVRIIAAAPPEKRAKFLFFVSSIEQGRLKSNFGVPEALVTPYREALSKLRDLTLACFQLQWKQELSTVLLGALACGMGWTHLSSALLDHSDAEECPNCGQPLPLLGHGI